MKNIIHNRVKVRWTDIGISARRLVSTLVESRKINMDCTNWFDLGLLETDGWMPDEGDEELVQLWTLRRYVRTTRGEDIGAALFVYLNRVIYSGIDESTRLLLGEITGSGCYHRPIGWETIRKFPCEHPDGTESYIEIDKRSVKLCFLRAWLEVAQWEKGSNTESAPFLLPSAIEDIGLSPEARDHFLLNESLMLSHGMMRSFHDRWLSLKPEQRDSRPRFYDKSLSRPGEKWHVFVPSDLWRYYYGEDEEISDVLTQHFPPANGEWKTITCLRKTETRHAVVANFIAWQEWLYALKGSQGDPMDEHRDILNQHRTSAMDASGDNHPITPAIREILRKISLESGIKGLSESETALLEAECAISPRIRVLRRMAQLHHTRAVIGEAMARKQREEVAARAFRPLLARVLDVFADFRRRMPTRNGKAPLVVGPKRSPRNFLILSTAVAGFIAAAVLPMPWRQPPRFEELVLTGITRQGQILRMGPTVRERKGDASPITLKSGEHFRLTLKTDRSGYTVVALLDSGGGVTPLFSGITKSGESLDLPVETSGIGYTLDNHAGTETILVISQRRRIDPETLKGRLEALRRSGPDQAGEIFPKARVEMLRFSHE